MDLIHKHAIVTGSSRGIGLAITRALLEEGVKVAGWSRSRQALQHADFHPVIADIADPHAVEEAFQQTREVLGNGIHILINNAGIGYRGNTEDMRIEDWQNLFHVNVHGLFYVTRLVIPSMKARQEGHIINISSGAGTNGIAGMTAYCGTKHAVTGISHALHAELRSEGIKVTCLSPGSVETHFEKNMGAKSSGKNKMMPEDIASSVIHALKTSQNYHYVDMEVRPLQPNK